MILGSIPLSRSFATQYATNSLQSRASSDWKLFAGLGLAGAALWQIWNGNEAFEVRADEVDASAPTQASPEEIIRHTRTAAEAGDAQAQYDYAVMLYRGEGMKQNFDEAIKWFEKAANGGVPEAKYNLGLLLLTGHRIKQNVEKSLVLLNEAASLGVAQAAERLGRTYSISSTVPGVSTSARRSREYYKMAADLGSVEGMFMMGAMMASGQGGAQNEKASFEYFKAAAERGHAASICNTALMYHNGVGTEPNLAAAFKLYQEAATIGDVDALTFFALFQLYGARGIVEQNVSQAVGHLQTAALHGSSAAQRTLAALYLGRGEFGSGVEQEFNKTIDSREVKATEASREAPINVSFANAHSDDRRSRLVVAYELFAECARHDDNACRSELASMILSAGPDQLKAQREGGITEPRHAGNLKLAYNLLLKASEEEHIPSKVKRAVMLQRGLGVAENRAAGVALLKALTAAKHNPIASYLVGAAYIQGDGVEKSYTEGMQHMTAGCAQRYLPAQIIVETMQARPSTDVLTLFSDLEQIRDSVLSQPEDPIAL